MDPLTVLKGKGSFLIQVKTGKKKTAVLDYDKERDLFIVAVAAPPIEGKANAEIERFFSKLLSKSVRIKSGHTGKKKILEAR